MSYNVLMENLFKLFGSGASCGEICRAACCQDIEIELSPKEAAALVAAGAVLYGKHQRDVYRLEGKCPNLTSNNRCGVHGTSEQPSVCKSYSTLGHHCRARRRLRPDLIKSYTDREKGEILQLMELELKVARQRRDMGLD